MKKYNKYCLKRNSFDILTNEKSSDEFHGALISKNDNKYKFAFKVDGNILTLEIISDFERVFVKQRFKDANIEITFLLNKKGKYCLNLENSYSLCFITEATFIKHSENEINLKYNLFDEKTNKIISLNEIIIIGEELC